MQKSELVRPRSVQMTGLMCFAVFGALGVISYKNIAPQVFTDSTWWTTVCFAAFAFLGAFLSIASLIEKHMVSEVGLKFRNCFGIRRTIAWSDLRSIRYFGYPKSYFRLETNSGTVIRISAMLRGLPQFAGFLLERAPEDSIDHVTLGILDATAAGIPPL